MIVPECENRRDLGDTFRLDSICTAAQNSQDRNAAIPSRPITSFSSTNIPHNKEGTQRINTKIIHAT